MNLFQRLLKKDPRAKAYQARAGRAEEIERLGLKLIDRSGWNDGKYVAKAYLLEQDGEIVGGPYASSIEALRAARELAKKQTQS